MNLGSILVLVVIFVLLALAILFISQNGGWQGGCGGNCASCHHKCADPKPKDDSKT
ncbi:FeoB-associated Cys-rich membrane protein [uncultured Subdoligranulum sp.]|uniref:FeoB-associated Cys-rich membrane protein n=1 Tax=uncultured Subdoligranulum sp. TaxID=512298 RepID=UPI003208F354